MLQAIRQTFFKIRVFVGAIRAGIIGLALVISGWIFLAPPSATELAVMRLPADTPSYDPLIRAHRMAKIVAMIDSDRFYDFLATQADTGHSGEQIRDNVEFAADGFGGFAGEASPSPSTDDTQKAFVTSGGAKFVPARTN